MREVDWSRVPAFGEPRAGTRVRPSAYAIVQDEAGRFAVVRTKTGLHLPGGGSDAGESPDATVVREAREECGFELALGAWRRHAIEHVYSDEERTQFEKRCTFMDARRVGGPGVPMEPDHELLWLTAAEAMVRLKPLASRWAIGEWVREGSLRAQ